VIVVLKALVESTLQTFNLLILSCVKSIDSLRYCALQLKSIVDPRYFAHRTEVSDAARSGTSRIGQARGPARALIR
jgi:hypothetical protein